MAERGGQVGNKNATKDKRLITNALNKVVVQNPDKLKAACEKVLDDAVDGNLASLAFISDRLEGKPAQSVTVGGDAENPLTLLDANRPILSKDEWLKLHGLT